MSEEGSSPALALRDDELVERMVVLFKDASTRVAAALNSESLPVSVAVPRVVMEGSDGGGGWTTRNVTVQTNVLGLISTPPLGPVFTEWLIDAEMFARAIAARYEQWIPAWNSIFPAGFELFGLTPDAVEGGDPGSWVLHRIVLRSAHWYLTHVPSLSEPDEDLARQISREVVVLVPAGPLLARQTIAVDGIDPESGLLECGGNRLRALSGLERGDFLEMPAVLRGLGHLSRFPIMSYPSHVLEMDREAGRPNEIGLLPVPSLIVALQLHQIEWAGPGVLSTYLLPEWLSFGRISRAVPTRPYPSSQSKLTRGQFEEACETAKLLIRYRLEPPERSSELALHRFTSGCGRSDPADSLIDFIVALEALLLPYDDESRNSNLSYRFRLHGAYFIAGRPLERRSVFRALGKLYDTRSRLVHGSSYPDPAETLAAAGDARRLAARGLLKAVREGFPDPPGFNRMVLGET